MRIIHIVNSLGRGGAENLVIGLVREMRLQGHTACIVSLTDCIEYQDLISAYGIDVHCCGNQGTIYSIGNLLRTTLRLRMLLLELNPDVINTHIYLADILTRLIFGRRVPIITTFHRNEEWWSSPQKLRKKAKRWVESFTARHLTKVFIAVSKVSSDEAVKFLKIKENLCTIVKNGVDVYRFKPPVRALALPPRIIQVARFYPEKCHEVSLKAFKEVLRSIPDAELWLVGDGPDLARIKQIAAKMELSGKIHFLGLRADISQLLEQCSLFWLTSRLEGLPISLLEAMATGLPPVVTAVGDIVNVVQNGHNGYLVAPGDYVSLADLSCALLKNDQLYQTVSTAAVQTIQQEYSITDTATHYLDIYRAASGA